MLLSRIYLRNFRVYEQELDIELPPGLVGIYGANGAGKSTLLEAILWTLWGKARTSKEEIRSSGVGADCVTEVTFEHESHMYLVRRTISGAACTVKAEAHCDGQIMSEGVRDTARYLHSVLGMDDSAFRASVFAEQKQLSAFSTQGPAERRKLVLQLLGITPLDTARDNARRDARQAGDEHKRLRGLLPDLDALRVEADDTDARAGAAETSASEEEAAAHAAAEKAAAASVRFEKLDEVRQTYDALVIEGRAARDALNVTSEQLQNLKNELSSLDSYASQLADIEPLAAKRESTESRVSALENLLQALETFERVSSQTSPEPPAPDDATVEEAAASATSAAGAVGAAEGRRNALAADLERASAAAKRSASLSEDEDCPMCGQALGQAFVQVQQHRQEEIDEANRRLAEADTALKEARETAKVASEKHRKLSEQNSKLRRTREAWQQQEAGRQAAEANATSSWAIVDERDPKIRSLIPNGTATEAKAALTEARKALRLAREATEQVATLKGRIERRPLVEKEIETLSLRQAESADLVTALLDKAKSLGFDKEALASARAERDTAAGSAAACDRRARQLRVDATKLRERADGEKKRLADATQQHDALAELESRSRHLSRVSDLLNAFRTEVVGSVGPRLATQAAEMFAELTDSEYDRLEVDPETYGLQIRDGGLVYGLDRFSGSEIDLANLALRVAISEHVRFQSGGTVGLLVLDEVFGPLDEDRKMRMIQALERLKGRFRQILVVTHATDIKEQLPGAVEVLKLPGRRATARVLGD